MHEYSASEDSPFFGRSSLSLLAWLQTLRLQIIKTLRHIINILHVIQVKLAKMSNRVAINANPTTIDGDHSDASSSEKPTGQVIPTGALRCRYSNAKDTNSFDSAEHPFSNTY